MPATVCGRINACSVFASALLHHPPPLPPSSLSLDGTCLFAPCVPTPSYPTHHCVRKASERPGCQGEQQDPREDAWLLGNGSLIPLVAGWRPLGPAASFPLCLEGCHWRTAATAALLASSPPPTPRPLASPFFCRDTHGRASEVVCFPQPRRARWQPGGQ